MKYVYSPSENIEAHMLVHMLEQAGIKAFIQGEALLSAAGGLPVGDLIKIAVTDEDYESARKLILEWERKNLPDTSNSKPLPKSSESAWASILLVGLILGWLANSYFEKVGLFARTVADKIDQNKDGKADFIYHFKSENAAFPESSENDTNFDGKFDVIDRLDPQGIVISGKEDRDFNGTFETIVIYKNGIPEKSEGDTDGDGKADIVNLFGHGGILKQTQILDPKTDKVKRIGYYENSMLKSADFDSDGDGILETHYTYDRYEQVVSTEKESQN
jgi:hypothetical protein